MGIYLLKVNNSNSRTWCEICLKLTIKTAERYQVISLRCLYCKFYTHFTTCVALVLLTLNMQLFAGQLSSFCEDIWEIHIEVVMLIFFEKKFHCKFELSFVTYNRCLCETPVKELFGSNAGEQILQIYKKMNVLYNFMHSISITSSKPCTPLQIRVTFIQIDKEAGNARCSKK